MDSNPLMIRDTYTFKRLVFINSCGHAYTDLDISEHVLMSGRNNAGKTSSLSAIKLFVFPEVNFRDCPQKFNFNSSGSKFDGQQSFHYYFPSNESFIILESENPHGPFCTILSRGAGELSYARLFVPEPYKTIKEYFWDFNDEDIGQPASNLSREVIKNKLSSYSPAFVTDVESIKRAIYQENGIALDNRLERFCLVPLPDGGSPNEVKAFKSLVDMAFDSSESKAASLPQAVATIIEGERRSAKEKLSVRLDDIIDEYTQLSKESERLIRLEDNLHYWESAKQASREFRIGLESASNLHANLIENINSVREELCKEKTELDSALQMHNDARNEAETNYSKARDSARELHGQLNELRKNVTDVRNKIERVTTLRSQYPGHSDEDIITIQHEVIEDYHRELNSLRSEESRSENWSNLSDEKRVAKEVLDQAENALKTVSGATLTSVSPHAASILRSLNPAFSSHRTALDKTQIVTIEDFAAQFDTQENRLRWVGKDMVGVAHTPYDPESEIERLNRQIADRTETIKKIDSILKKISEGAKLTKAERETKIRMLEKEIAEATNDIKLIKAYDLNAEELPDKEQELNSKTQSYNLAEQQTEKLKVEFESALATCNETRTHLKDIDSRISSIDISKSYIERHQLSDIEGFSVMAIHNKRELISENDLESKAEEFHALCEKVSAERRTLLGNIRLLVRREVVDGVTADIADRDNLDMDEIRTIYERFSADFGNLEQLKKNHDANILTHNQLTNNTISELKANRDSITSFQEELNRSLEGANISDLTDIRVEVDLERSFTELLKKVELRNANSLDMAVLSDQLFYNDLQSFVQNYFHRGRQSNVLNLHNIISNVRFRYKKNGVDEDKPQSTGTTSMFVAVLLSILIERLISGAAELHMPMVVDEGANIDAENLKMLFNTLEKHNFRMFSATPEISGLLAHLFGRWVEISAFSIDNPYAPNCSAVWLGEHNTLLEAV